MNMYIYIYFHIFIHQNIYIYILFYNCIFKLTGIYRYIQIRISVLTMYSTSVCRPADTGRHGIPGHAAARLQGSTVQVAVRGWDT